VWAVIGFRTAPCFEQSPSDCGRGEACRFDLAAFSDFERPGLYFFFSRFQSSRDSARPQNGQ
jgi:hypothetical protein